ncbi:MAG: transposase [Candidatus Marithrix sp.]|nr:transposase [Candidatus Marithrix sp.]
MKYKRHLNTPIHFFCDDTPYFITAAIYEKRLLLADDSIKTKLLEIIQNCFQEKGWMLDHWVILDNHYHVLVNSRKGEDLSKIIRAIHKQSGFLISKMTNCKKPVWWNYWDYCPRDEKDYLIRLNYLLNNPIKHGYVNNLHNYPYSSFHNLLDKKGRDVLIRQFKEHPEYKDLKMEKDDF